jgi:ribosome-binding protein aMBF1 (putative translation factor)
LYQEYRTMYINILADYQEKEKEMKAIHKKTLVLKKLSASIDDRGNQTMTAMESQQEQQRVLAEANELIRQYQALLLEKKETKQLLSEFEFMKELDSIDKFREYVQSSRYWADTWAISTLERLLNIKLVILSEEAFATGEKDAVMQCGQLNDTKIEEQKTFAPDYYIITSYSGNHYKLISYKEKQIFRFREIPYDVKTMIVNKCLERNAGPYYLIQDFRNYKSKIGIDADMGRPEEDNYLDTDLYEKDVVFMFHSNSNANPKPGYGSGEQIPANMILDYKSLNKLKNWRRKLSDEWPVQITVDGHRWNSAMHYYLGSQYKKGYPDFYLQFSTDSGSELSKNVDMAIAASSKSGKYNDRLVRPANVKVDPDFYEISNNSRSEQERYTALNAKFTQNQDMKQILMETRRAKLIHFVRGREPEIDVMLMKLRRELA